MKLEFKVNFGAAAGQWDRFWRGENTRPSVSAILPMPGVTPVDKPEYAAGAREDFEPVIDRLLAWAETHLFLADAIPHYYLEFSADHFAALLGADLKFIDSGPGGWAVPFVRDLSRAEIRFDRDGYWWQRTVSFAEALRARCDGKLLIASPTLVANADALAAVYGSERLLLAMVDQPDAVHGALAQIDRAHEEILDAFGELFDYARFGSINRHGMYCAGRINVPQCDFSCTISPGMFREFVVPYLTREMERLDAAEYHLDGPDAIEHLEALCEIDALDLIQWVAGAGRGEQQDWTALFDRIDALGKGQLRGGSPGVVKEIWQTYNSRKIYFNLVARSQSEVEDCLAELERTKAGAEAAANPGRPEAPTR
jgi:5-methyltetrahydrofolate--homocysteine methyltransferase